MMPRIPGSAGRHVSFAVLAVLLLAAIVSYGQVTSRGSITGTVTDPTGAAVANANVVVRDTATNVARTTATNTDGYFQVVNINASTYKITVTAEGFETLVREGVTVAADARVSVPLPVKVGSTRETVTVTADAGLLNTESGSTGYVLSRTQVESIPVSGTNPMWLVQASPGIQTPAMSTSSIGDTLSWNGVSKFGSNGYLNANEYIVDGIANMGNPRGNGIALSMEALDEMKVEAVSFDAAYGHTMGAMVTQTTKAGTNELHGTVHQTFQDRDWAALQHFQGLNYAWQQHLSGCDTAPDGPMCQWNKDRYGSPGTHYNYGSYALGGPVVIPKVINGRNKLFFFFNTDVNNWTDVAQTTPTLPSMKMRQGDFSEFPAVTTNVPAEWQAGGVCAGSPYYGQYQIYNPFSVQLVNGKPVRQPFCGNKIPANLLSANAKMVSVYNSLLPAPSQASLTGWNYMMTVQKPQTYRNYTGRMDYSISENNQIFWRYSRQHYTNDAGGWNAGNADLQLGPRTEQLGALGWNHVFTPATSMSVTAGATDYNTECCYYPNLQKLAPSTLGLPASLDGYAGAKPTFPIINVNSYSMIGQNNSTPQIWKNYNIAAIVNHLQGKHSFRFGGEYRQQKFSQTAWGNTSGSYNFDNTYTRHDDGTNPLYPSSNWGLSYAAFLLGIPSSNSVQQGYPLAISTPYFAAYAADAWRVSRKLTLLPGVRFEYEFGPAEQNNGQIVGWDPNAVLPISDAANAAYQAAYAAATPAQQAVLPSTLVIKGGPMYAGVNGAPTRMFVNSARVLPRLGAAYQLTPNTVIRAGYGIFSDTLNVHTAPYAPHAGNSGVTAIGTWNGDGFTTNQDGYSVSTSVPSSTTFGTNFVAGTTPLSNPFPNGFNTPYGNSAGSMYYLGLNPTIYDQNMKPASAQRFYVGVQRQLNQSTMVELAWLNSYTKGIGISVPLSAQPQGLYSAGNQPAVDTNALMSSQITNPFNISNFGFLANSNPAAYKLISNNGYYTQPKISINSLVRAYPQMNGLNMWKAAGLSRFHELQANLTKRYSNGLTILASLQLNDQQDADYYANGFDSAPSWRPSNNSMPYRMTAQALYELPFGKGKAFAQSGVLAWVLGGFKISTAWEHQAGQLIEFNNLFYIGDPTADKIRLQQPKYVNNLTTGGYNYVQWLDSANVATATYDSKTKTCTYTGSGFVTNPSCQPNGYNARVFPTRIDGLRQQPLDAVNASMQRVFRFTERFNFEARADVMNLLNHQVLGGIQTSPTSPQFGQITSDIGYGAFARWILISGRLRF